MNNILKIKKRTEFLQMQKYSNNLDAKNTVLELKTQLLVPVINSNYYLKNGISIIIDSVFLYKVDANEFPFSDASPIYNFNYLEKYELDKTKFYIKEKEDFFKIYTNSEFFEPNLQYNCFYYIEINILNIESLRTEIFKLKGEPVQDLTNLLQDFDFQNIIDFEGQQILIQ